jgi:Spx/MgsR family transcriptional regulator
MREGPQRSHKHLYISICKGRELTLMPIQFLQKPTCTTCRKAKAYLEKLGADLQLRNLDTQHLSAAELESLIGERDYKPFLNTRNELFRTRNMKDKPPSRAEAIQLMAKNPNLIRRPVVICGKEIVLGHNEDAFRKLAKRRSK